MIKWEYETMTKDAQGNARLAFLNEMGQKGWELVGFHQSTTRWEDFYIFKRPIKEPS